MKQVITKFGGLEFGILRAHLLIIKKWFPTYPLAEIAFSSTEFWIQVHSLAPICMLKENATTLGILLVRDWLLG